MEKKINRLVRLAHNVGLEAGKTVTTDRLKQLGAKLYAPKEKKKRHINAYMIFVKEHVENLKTGDPKERFSSAAKAWTAMKEKDDPRVKELEEQAAKLNMRRGLTPQEKKERPCAGKSQKDCTEPCVYREKTDKRKAFCARALPKKTKTDADASPKPEKPKKPKSAKARK